MSELSDQTLYFAVVTCPEQSQSDFMFWFCNCMRPFTHVQSGFEVNDKQLFFPLPLKRFLGNEFPIRIYLYASEEWLSEPFHYSFFKCNWSSRINKWLFAHNSLKGIPLTVMLISVL
jgi:hypothetical protein